MQVISLTSKERGSGIRDQGLVCFNFTVLHFPQMIRYEIRRRERQRDKSRPLLEAARSRCGGEERKDTAIWRAAMPLSHCHCSDKTREL